MSARIIDRGRGPEIEGTRITVYAILEYLKEGWHDSSIAMTLRLSSEQVREAIRYIERHRDAVETEYARIMARIERGNPPEIEAKRKRSRAKLRAMIEARKRNTSGAGRDAEDRRRQ